MLEEIRITDSVTVIGDRAFYGVYGLQRVYLGSKITGVYKGAFKLCPHLSDVYFSESRDDWNKIYIAAENEQLTSTTIRPDYE